jgi:hypothetical protein
VKAGLRREETRRELGWSKRGVRGGGHCEGIFLACIKFLCVGEDTVKSSRMNVSVAGGYQEDSRITQGWRRMNEETMEVLNSLGGCQYYVGCWRMSCMSSSS